jgi:hypothetical protein
MKRYFQISLALFVMLALQTISAQSVQFKVPITLVNGTDTTKLYIGVSGDGSGGSITDNTFGVDIGAAFGDYSESLAAPAPPAYNFRAVFMTIPGHDATYPNGLGATGTTTDYRGYSSLTQIDTFKIVIAGDNTDVNSTIVSWPSDLNYYGTKWTILPQNNTGWSSTNMISSSSVTIPASATKNIIIIKEGAKQPVTGPTFVLSSSSLDFGSVPVNTSSSKTVTVNNTGMVNALSISGVTLANGFTVSPSTFPVNVPAQGSVTFTVRFAPVAASAYSGNIVFKHNASGDSTLLAVSGSGASQGGTLSFSSDTKTTKDFVFGVTDSIKINYVGVATKAFQLRLIVDTSIVTLKSVAKGSGLSSSWVLADTIVHGAADTAKIFVYGPGAGDSLVAGSYSSLITFTYDVKALKGIDTKSGVFKLANVLGSTELGVNSQWLAGSDQAVTVNRGAKLGDISNDGSIDIQDVILDVNQILGKGTALDSAALAAADVAPWGSPDGVIDARDVALLLHIILTDTYPDGSPLAKKSALYASKVSSNTDVALTFYVSKKAVRVSVKNSVALRGIQMDINNVSSMNGTATSSFGQIYSNLNGTSLRTLIFDQNSDAPLAAGERVIATIPTSTSNPSSITISGLKVIDENVAKVSNVSSEVVVENTQVLPTSYSLEQNFPNPFNPSTTISFAVPQTSNVTIEVYNSLGQKVRSLFSGKMEQGTNSVVWNARDDYGREVAAGAYLYRMTAGSYVQVKKMMLVK